MSEVFEKYRKEIVDTFLEKCEEEYKVDRSQVNEEHMLEEILSCVIREMDYLYDEINNNEIIGEYEGFED